jgi:hypothetical protein
MDLDVARGRRCHIPTSSTAQDTSMTTDPKPLLRHTLATLAYRADKALCDAPPGFSTFRAGPSSRSPGEILAHLGDLLDWAAFLARGTQRWQPVTPGDWDADVLRFFAAVQALDVVLQSDLVTDDAARRVFQGPIADALTHVGQLNFLRRLAGSPVKAENYARASAIRAGNLGPRFGGPRAEF